MIADLIAATTAPAPTGHDAYDWWSDIWLPALVGVGSVGAAAIAVIVAARSNRLARAATKAAERSNALARQALAHEKEQAAEAANRAEREARAKYADRALLTFDQFLDRVEAEQIGDASRSLADLGSLNMEAISNGWAELSVNELAGWAFERPPTEPEARAAHFRRIRHGIHAVVSSWAREPRSTKAVLGFMSDFIESKGENTND